MLTSIRYWVQAAGLVEPDGKRIGGRLPLRLSRVGRTITESDQYFEDMASLWVTHLGLASNKTLATMWYWAFNELDEPTFSETDLVEGFAKYATSVGKSELNERSIKKDVSVFVRTYLRAESQSGIAALEDRLDCPLAALGLLDQTRGRQSMAFRVGAKESLLPALVAYGALRFRDSIAGVPEVVSLDDLRWAPRSPGRLFQLDSRSLVEALQDAEEVAEGRWFRVSRTAGLGNVHFNTIDPIDVLKWHYLNDGSKEL